MLVSALLGIVGGLVILVGSAVLHGNAAGQLTRLKTGAAAASPPPSVTDLETAIAVDVLTFARDRGGPR